MNFRLFLLPLLATLATCGPAGAHDTDSRSGTLGKVSFATSCDPKVQAAFERAVAMLHSFWYSAGEKAFRTFSRTTPNARSPRGASRRLLMSNPLAGQGASAKGAEQAQAAIDQGRRIGAKTQRERDYIEAVAAYYEDFATRPERERQIARAKAYEALAKRYPTDDEAQIFYALYIAGTQTQATRPTRPTSRRLRSSNTSSEVSRPSRRGALPDPQLRRAADRRQGGLSPRAGMRASRPTRRTRCTCLRTSSRASAPGRSRSPPTCARATWPRQAMSRTRPTTPAITWCTRTCSSRATRMRAPASTKR